MELRDLSSDKRMVGRWFKLSTDAKGDQIFGGDANSNGSVSFELDQLTVGSETVTIPIVLYINATYIKHWIPILPTYSELFS
jgi:hypothetical protein